jgi:hypothetical protein
MIEGGRHSVDQIETVLSAAAESCAQKMDQTGERMDFEYTRTMSMAAKSGAILAGEKGPACGLRDGLQPT